MSWGAEIRAPAFSGQQQQSGAGAAFPACSPSLPAYRTCPTTLAHRLPLLPLRSSPAGAGASGSSAQQQVAAAQAGGPLVGSPAARSCLLPAAAAAAADGQQQQQPELSSPACECSCAWRSQGGVAWEPRQSREHACATTPAIACLTQFECAATSSHTNAPAAAHVRDIPPAHAHPFTTQQQACSQFATTASRAGSGRCCRLSTTAQQRNSQHCRPTLRRCSRMMTPTTRRRRHPARDPATQPPASTTRRPGECPVCVLQRLVVSVCAR